MTVGVALEISALLLLGCLIIAMFYRTKLWAAADKVLFLLIVVCTLSTLADITNVYIENEKLENLYGLMYWSTFAYFVLRNLTPLAYLSYIITLTGQWNALRKRTVPFISLVFPTVAVTLLVITNFWTDAIFYYDAAKEYHRGDQLWILYSVAFYFMAYSIVFTVQHQDQIEKEKRWAIFLFVPFTFVAVILQFINVEMRLEMLFTALCIMLIMFTLQRREEVVDGATGLWNRAAFIRDVQKYLAGKQRFTVISIYIGNLELLNKTLGFRQTEQAVLGKAGSLRHYLTAVNAAYTVGQGKYELVLWGKKAQRAWVLAEELNRIWKDPWQYQGLELGLPVYLAVSDCPADFEDEDALLRFSDVFYQYAPCPGQVFRAGELKKKLPDQDLEQIIEQALLDKRFEVYYQPILCTEDGRFRSAEALVRLYDDRYGFIPPSEFIPVAEANTSIIEIGRFVLEEVCEFIAMNRLQEWGIDFIEINLSVVQCMQSDLAEQVMGILRRYEVEPSQINLEITETAAINSSEIMLKNMQRLWNEGIRFSLDDYGTGYANLSYLLNFPFSLIKLDRELVAWESESEKGTVAMRYTIEMLRAMGFRMVAEGVENKELADFLSENGCDYQQGYFFSRPMPGADFLKFLEERSGAGLFRE